MKASSLTRFVFSLLIGVGAAMGILLGLKPSRAETTVIGNNFFVTPHGSGNCSQASPCNLPQALSLAEDSNSIYLGEGVYTGTGAAVVTLTNSIRLMGGWNGSPVGIIIRDPSNYVSQLDGERERRVVMIQQNITPTLDGLTIAHGNATGLVQNCDSVLGEPDGCGGGIFAYQADPIIINNLITNNIGTIGSIGYPTRTNGYGGGIYLDMVDKPIVRGNRIISNAASTAFYGGGGGIFLGHSYSGGQILDNEISNNHATTQDTYVAGGGGIADYFSYGLVIRGNIFDQNWSSGSDTKGNGSAIIQRSGLNHYEGNQITNNHGLSAIYLEFSQAHFEQNRVMHNQAMVDIDITTGYGSKPKLVNNVIASDNSNQAIRILGWKDNVFTTTLFYNTLVGSGSGTGIHVDQYIQLYLTDTIVVSYTWGITNVAPMSSTIQADKTLFDANTHNGIEGSHPIFGNPLFINPAAGDYHIQHASQARDKGICTSEPDDIDGETRPIGALCDIGADEWSVKVYLPLVVR